MWKDPIVEEVREAGGKLAKKCGYDFHKFSMMIKRHQNQNKANKIIVSKREIRKKTA